MKSPCHYGRRAVTYTSKVNSSWTMCLGPFLKSEVKQGKRKNP